MISSGIPARRLFGLLGALAFCGVARGASLISSPGASFGVTTLVRNDPPDARMLVSGSVANQEHLYHPMYLIGDHGALGRPEAEASHLGYRLETIKAMPKGSPKKEAKKKAELSDDEP